MEENRDFDQEEILNKMRSLRDKRDLEFLAKQLDSESEKVDTEEKVLNVKYLGSIDFEEEIDGEKVKTQKDVFLVLEQIRNKEGELVQVERYYTEEGELIGGNNKSDEFDFITLTEKYADKKDILDQLKKLDKEGILDLEEMEQSRLEEIAKTIGVEVEDLDKVIEIENEGEEQEQEQEEVLTEEEVEKISTKTEIATNQKVTDKETISSLLGIQDKGYQKIAVIYSEKLQDNSNSTRFSFVGITKEGTAEKIDTLEQRYGTTPTKQINSFNRDGSELEEQQVNSIYQVKGRTEEQLAIKIGSMGTIEASLVRTPRQDNEEAISIPIETHNIRSTTRNVRELMNRQRNSSVKEEIEKIQYHRNLGCEEIDAKDIDDNDNNNTHSHEEYDNEGQQKVELDEEYLRRCAREILDDEENGISQIYNERDVMEKLRKSSNEKEYSSKEEWLEDVENDLQENAEQEHQPPEHKRS